MAKQYRQLHSPRGNNKKKDINLNIILHLSLKVLKWKIYSNLQDNLILYILYLFDFSIILFLSSTVFFLFILIKPY